MIEPFSIDYYLAFGSSGAETKHEKQTCAHVCFVEGQSPMVFYANDKETLTEKITNFLIAEQEKADAKSARILAAQRKNKS